MSDDVIAAAVTAATTVVNPFGAFEKWAIRVGTWFVLILVVVGGIVGVTLYIEHRGDTSAPKTEAAAPAVVQSDGSLMAQRAATAPDTKPFNFVPKGAKVLRQESVTVQPKSESIQLKTATGLTQAETVVPKPVTLQMDLLQMPDGTERVTASSPDGQVTGALDVPVALLPPDPPKNAAGLSYGIPIAGVHAAGAWYERDVWRARVGVELDRFASAHGSNAVAMVRLGVTF